MRLRAKLLLFLALTTLFPLGAYGVYATWSGIRGTQEGVTAGTRAAASEVAKRVGAFVRGRVDVVRAVGAAVSPGNGLDATETDRVLARALLEDRTLRYLVDFDHGGKRTFSTLLPDKGPSKLVRGAADKTLATGKPQVTQVVIGDDLLPVMAVAVPVHRLGRTVGALAAEVDTLELWSMVRDLRLGRTGYTYLVDRHGHLFAHGIAKELVYAIQRRPYPTPRIVNEVKKDGGAVSATYDRRDGVQVVGAAASVPGTDWVAVVETPARDAFAQARALGLGLLIVLFAALLAVGTVAFIGARTIVNPVERLAAGARRIGEGDFTVRVHHDRPDELGDLARGFNHMAEDLGTLTQEIRRQERLAFFGRIAGGLAHDLKRPFQHLITHVRTFLDIPETEATRQDLEANLDREQAYIDRLFADLSEFANPREAEPSPVVLPALLGRLQGSLTATARNRNITLTLVIEGRGDPVVEVDALALERAVRNLVENALDALRGNGGHVTLRVGLEVSRVTVVVEDDGPGIPPALLHDLFDAFRTTKGSGNGLGLGLAVVRRIVEEQGGTVSAGNRPSGGAVFVVTLPRRARPPVAESSPDAA